MHRKHLLIVVACLLVGGALASLVLYEASQAPLNPEVIEVAPTRWNMTRPEGWGQTTTFFDLEDTALNSHASDTTIIRWELSIYHLSCYDYYEQLVIGFNATATVTEGFIHSFRVIFDVESHNASVDICEDRDWFKTRNVEIRRIEDDWGENFVDAQAMGRPATCMFKLQLYWMLFDRNTANHTMLATLETTYFNGTVYEKAKIPIRLSILAS